MNAKIATLLGIALALAASVVFLRAGTSGTAALWAVSNEGTWLLPLVGVAALVDSINPCA